MAVPAQPEPPKILAAETAQLVQELPDGAAISVASKEEHFANLL